MEKPILFTTPMLRAILTGNKTQTRRIIKPQPVTDKESGYIFFKYDFIYDIHDYERWQKDIIKSCNYKIGDTLWVRETWRKRQFPGHDIEYFYKADMPEIEIPYFKWKPSIYMPKTACRIKLQIMDIWVERLHYISNDDIIAEGIKKIEGKIIGYPFGVPFNYSNGIANYATAKEAYMQLWNIINGKDSWNLNPWVWVIEFKRI